MLRYAVAVLAAGPLALSTLLLGETVAVRSTDRPVEYGYPIHFVTARPTLPLRGDVPASMREVTHAFDPWEDPHHFHAVQFVVSWAIVAAMLVALVWALPRLVRTWPLGPRPGSDPGRV